jgi:hypothetical protein
MNRGSSKSRKKFSPARRAAILKRRHSIPPFGSFLTIGNLVAILKLITELVALVRQYV